MFDTKILIALALILGAASARAQLEDEWLGKWTSSEKSTLDVSKSRLLYAALQCDEGRCVKMKPVPCSWSRDGESIKKNPFLMFNSR